MAQATSQDRDRTLYLDNFWASPYAMISYVALREKGLAFTTHNIALEDKEQRTANYLAVSLTGKIPCLVDGSFSVTESTAIVDYLDEAYSFPNFPRLLPAEVKDRARARQILSWLNSDFMALRTERPTQSLFYGLTVQALSEKAQYDVERLLTFFRSMLADGRPNLFGREWCIADAASAMMLLRLVGNKDLVPEWAKSYTEAQWQRSSLKAFREEKRAPYRPY